MEGISIKMNYFETQMFNPNYINEEYYRHLQAQKYAADQNERVMKVVNSFRDMLDQVNAMDEQHQQQAFLMCLAEIARRNGW